MLNYVTTSAPAELAKKNLYANQAAVKNYEYAPDWMFGNPAMGDIGDGVQINGSTGAVTNGTTTVETNGNLVSGCDDGKDDGKISFGSKILNTLWGAGKAVVNTVKDIVTDPKKAIAAVATTAVCIAFPPAAVVVGAVGLVSGLKGCATAWQNASKATTDDEAKAAFQDFGASGLQVGLSAAAVKGGFGAMKATQGSAMSNVVKSTKGGFRGAIENTGRTTRAFFEDTVTGGRGFQQGTLKINTANAGYKGTQLWTTVKGDAAQKFENIKTNGAHPIQSARSSLQNAGKEISTAGQNIRANGVHPIRAARNGAGKFSTTAVSAGYNSGFGVLTAPVADQVTQSNVLHSNYGEAVLRNASYSTYTGGNYEFSQDWMNSMLNISGNYNYDAGYEELAQYAGYNARQVIDI